MFSYLQLCVLFVLDRAGIDVSEESGQGMTEYVVVLGVVLAVAAVIAVVVMNTAQEAANQMQVPAPPGG